MLLSREREDDPSVMLYYSRSFLHRFVEEEGLSEALQKHGTLYRGRILQVRKKIKTTGSGFRGRRALASSSLRRNSNSPAPRARASLSTSESPGSLVPSPFESGVGSTSGQARNGAAPGAQRHVSSVASSTAVCQQRSPATTALPMHTTSGPGTTASTHVSEDLPQPGSTQRAGHRPGHLNLNTSAPSSTVSSNFPDDLSKSSDPADSFFPGSSNRSAHGPDAARRSPPTRRRFDGGAGLPAKPPGRLRSYSSRGKAPAQSHGDAFVVSSGGSLAAPFYPSEAAPPHPPPPMMPQPYAVTYINGQMVHVLPPVTIRQGSVPPPTLPYEQYTSLVSNSMQASQGHAAEGTGNSTPVPASEQQPSGMTAPHPFYDFHQTESTPVEYPPFNHGNPNGEEHGGGPAAYGWPPMMHPGWQYGQQFPPFVPMYGPPMYTMHSPQSSVAPLHPQQTLSQMSGPSNHGDVSAPDNRRASYLGHAPMVSQGFSAPSAHCAQDLPSREGFNSSSSDVFGIPRGHPHYPTHFYPAHSTHFHQP